MNTVKTGAHWIVIKMMKYIREYKLIYADDALTSENNLVSQLSTNNYVIIYLG